MPKGAKEIKRPVQRTVTDKKGKTRTVEEQQSHTPPAYSMGSRRFVVLADDAQADAARQLAEELGAVVVVR